MIIIDVGACVGLFIDHCLKTYDVEALYAFEPLKVNYDYLVARYADNPKIKVFHMAVCNFDGEAPLYKKPDPDNLESVDYLGNVGCSLRRDKSNIRPDRYENVKVATLHGFFIQQAISWVDILKIDAEGSEYDIFEDLLINGLLPKIGEVWYEDHTRKIPRIWDKAVEVVPQIRAAGFAHKFFLQFTHEPVDYRNVFDQKALPWVTDRA